MLENAVGFIDYTDNELYECDLNDYHADELIETLPDAKPSDTLFQPISKGEIQTARLSEFFCLKVRNRLNRRQVLAFGLDEEGALIQESDSDPLIVIPHALKLNFLRIHHSGRMAGHPGWCKSYQTILK